MGYTLIKSILAPLLRLAYRIRVRGIENLPPQGRVIIAANHVSFIDSMFLGLIINRKVTFLAKAEYFDDPRVAWFFKMAGQIPIKREGGSASDRALASAREILQAGGVLAIYPEGTRSPDGRLYKGRTGVARMALSCDAPVVPVGLRGTAEAQPVGARIPRPFRTVHIDIGAPLRWADWVGKCDDRSVLRQVTDEVVSAIAGLSGQDRVADYASRPRPQERAADLPEPVRLHEPVGTAPVAMAAVNDDEVLAD